MNIRKMASIFLVIIAMLCSIFIPTQASVETANSSLANAIYASTNALGSNGALINDTQYVVLDKIPNINESIAFNGTVDVLAPLGTKLIQEPDPIQSPSSVQVLLDNISSLSKGCYKAVSFCITEIPRWTVFAVPFLIYGGAVGTFQYLLDKIGLIYLRSSILKCAEKSFKKEDCQKLDTISLAKRISAAAGRDDTNIMVCRLVYKLLFHRSLKEQTAWTLLSKRPLDTVTNLLYYLEHLLSYAEIFDKYGLDANKRKLSNINIQRQNFINLLSKARNSEEVLGLCFEMEMLIYFLEEFEGLFNAKTRFDTIAEFMSYSRALRELRFALYQTSEVLPQKRANPVSKLSLKIVGNIDDSITALRAVTYIITVLTSVASGGMSKPAALELLTRLNDRPNNKFFEPTIQESDSTLEDASRSSM